MPQRNEEFMKSFKCFLAFCCLFAAFSEASSQQRHSAHSLRTIIPIKAWGESSLPLNFSLNSLCQSLIVIEF